MRLEGETKLKCRIGIWKPLGATRQFSVGFFWHTPPQPALLLYRNLHASLKVTPVYWPFDLDVFCSIIIIILISFLVVIRFPVNSKINGCCRWEERLCFLFENKSITIIISCWRLLYDIILLLGIIVIDRGCVIYKRVYLGV